MNWKTTIIQKPNLPLIVWFGSYLVTKLPLTSQASHFFGALSFGALFTWAWMEIFYGVNIYRRLLGLTVMIFIMVGKLK
jgi:hypothetical protein